jgi:hypothetical protein
MKNELNYKKHVEVLDPNDLFLQQLLHLKGYERPNSERIDRSKQSIMRQIREVKLTQVSLGERIELHLPWLFAEPRYGIALLFVIFGLLQFWGVTLQESHQVKGDVAVKELSLLHRVELSSDAVVSPITNQANQLKEISNTDLIFQGVDEKKSLGEFVTGIKEEE